ncbi:Nuclear pore NUP53 [Hyphodiscus hymeniophilus]|uniref:Nuclear pore NUP53 n=1 Tax=Hyphodiscus hymeniophilus TaxID=353542 RepID=A0A9P7B027_9HELO|nr:Nuclear pore NUP53 [Hyphodiscus hymeniophilus]
MPLILHNVPDDELYVGEDGVQRPYAMLFPGNDGAASSRSRRVVPETGSFGKASTRRSSRTSRSYTPAATKVVKEDPTLAAADAIFTQYLAKQAAAPPDPSQRQLQRKASIPASASQPNLSLSDTTDGNAPASRYVHREPTEVILRGFKATQQWAAIREYERIGGQICEDYPREPPPEQRKFKADMRDPAVLRKRPLTLEEKAKANRFAGGETWIKITFESAEAAEAAVDSSPQMILGYTVYAELYRGVPPTASDEAIPAQREQKPDTPRSHRTLSRSTTTPNMTLRRRGIFDVSPPDSQASTQTLDSATLTATSVTASSATITGGPANTATPESDFCTKIPTAKRIKLLPSTEALLPQQSYTQKFLTKIPLINWFTSDIIGTAVPRTLNGEFDLANASLYWRVIYVLDRVFGCFDVAGDKDD